jgi:hypothetical protein
LKTKGTLLRHAWVLLVCSAAVAVCSPLHAQHGLEGKEAKAPKKTATKPEPKRAPPSTVRDRVRPTTPQSVSRPQDQRAREPERKAPPTMKQDRTRYSDIYPQQKSAPSPAQQLQQQQFEQQQLQRQQAAPQQPATPRERRGVRCAAHPVCQRPSGGYGSCQGVEQVYSSDYIGRRDIAAQCVRANTPDTCNCAAQCSRVAQCSIF